MQSNWTCLHLSITPLLLVRDVLSIENILSAYLRKSFEHFKTLDEFSSAPLFLEREKNLSSYDLLRKDVIIFVALRWTASSFAISFA